MTIEQCFLDFEPPHFIIAKTNHFNRLREKKTRLTTPSVVLYVKTKKNNNDRLEITEYVKVFVSMCPAIDIENDTAILENIDTVLICHSNETNSYSIEQREYFNSLVKEIKAFYSIE